MQEGVETMQEMPRRQQQLQHTIEGSRIVGKEQEEEAWW